MFIWIAAFIAGAAAVAFIYGLKPGGGLTMLSAGLRLIAITGQIGRAHV